MVLVGLLVLALLSGFIISVIITLLELLAVIIGIILVLGGVATIFFGRRLGRRSFDWGPPKSST